MAPVSILASPLSKCTATEKHLEVAVLDLSSLITATPLLPHAHFSRKAFFLSNHISHQPSLLPLVVSEPWNLWSPLNYTPSKLSNGHLLNKWMNWLFSCHLFPEFFFLRFIRLGFPDTLEWVTLCDDLDRLPIWQDLESSWESRRCTVRKSACSATTKNWVWIHRTHVK